MTAEEFELMTLVVEASAAAVVVVADGTPKVESD